MAVEVTREDVAEGGVVETALEMSNQDSVPLDLVVGRLTTSVWLDVPGGVRPFAGDVGSGLMRRVDLQVTALHWGHQEIGPAVAYAVAGDGLLVAWIIVFGTFLPFILMIGALHHLSATRVTVTAMVEPVVGALVAFAWLGESLGAGQIAGGLLVLAGVALAQTARARSPG